MEASYLECVEEVNTKLVEEFGDQLFENEQESDAEREKMGLYKRAYRLMLQNATSLRGSSGEELQKGLMADALIKNALFFTEKGFTAGSSRMLSEARRLINS